MTTVVFDDREIQIPSEMRYFSSQLCRLLYVGARKKKITKDRPIELAEIRSRWNTKHPDKSVDIRDILMSIDLLKMAGHNIGGDCSVGFYLDQIV